MAQTLVALFEDVPSAERAVRDLRDAGVPNADISLVARDLSGEYARELDRQRVERDEGADATATGAGIGATLGGLGGLLVGLGVLPIPGVGPVLAAGPLATALAALIGAGAGALTGGVAGGLLGALVDMGVPEEEAEYYAEGVRRGGALLMVRTPDDRADYLREILDRHNAVDIDARAESWRERGWPGYDPNAEPYSADEVERERTYYRTQTDDLTRADYDRYVPAFRGHYQTHYAQSGYRYEHFEPAYRYGLTLGNYEPYQGWDWDQIEPEARRAWEERNPGTWDRVKDAVYYGWERVRQIVRE